MATAGSNVDISNLLSMLSTTFAGTPKTTTTSETNPTAIGGLTSVINSSLGNATNPDVTKNLVNNIFQQSAIQFAPTLGDAQKSGLYNSSTLSMLQGYAQGQATSQASKAVLDYQTSQAQLAQQASSNLGQLSTTKTSTGSPAIPSDISTILGIGAGGLTVASHAKDIINFVKDPETAIDKLFSSAPATPGAGAGSVASSGGTAAPAGFVPGSSASDAISGISSSTDPGVASAIAAGQSDIPVAGASSIDAILPGAVTDSSAGLAGLTGITSIGTDLTGSAAAGDITAVTGFGEGLSTAGEVGGGIAAGAGAASAVSAGAGAAAVAGGADAALGVGAAEVGADAAVSAGAADGLAEAGTVALAAWIICTEFAKQGRLPAKWYIAGSRTFAAYPEIGKKAYFLWAIPTVKYIRKNPNSVASNILCSLFNYRAEYLAAKMGTRGARKLIRGEVVSKGLVAFTAVVGILGYPWLAKQDYRVVYSKKETA